jgi:pyrimidine deaminase RibD-like protein
VRQQPDASISVHAAYLNLEPVHGLLAGESASVKALCASGVSRVVVGLLHPLAGLRGQGVAALQAAGLQARHAREGAQSCCVRFVAALTACTFNVRPFA